MNGPNNPIEAEAMTLRMMMEKVLQEKYTWKVFESDNLNLMKMMKKPRKKFPKTLLEGWLKG